jgi:protein-tyrosine phosphatase
MPGLWVGSKPTIHDVVELNTFDVVVFAADSFQPDLIRGFKRTAIRCGIQDEAITPSEKNRAMLCARMVARSLQEGKRVLVTCISGWNRSSLVAAIAILMVTHMSAEQVVSLIRMARGKDALCNHSFVEFLREYRGGEA